MTNQKTPEQRGWILDEHGAKDHPLGDYRILWSSELGRAIRAHFTAAPVQGGAKLPQNSGATEEQIEAAARAIYELERAGSAMGGHWPTWDSLAEKSDRTEADLRREYARAALSASAPAHPADERHDAAERQTRASSIRIEIVQEMANRAYSEYEEASDDSYGAWSWLTEELEALRGIGPEDQQAESVDHAATVTGEPLYSLATGTWSSTCPCVRAEQVDPECEWHGREEFRCGGSHHPETRGPSDETVAKAARVLHISACCNLSAEAEHQEPQNEDLMAAGIVLSSVPLDAPIEVDAEKLSDAIADELGTDSWIARSLSNGKINATARRLVEFAVKPVLRGEGR